MRVDEALSSALTTCKPPPPVLASSDWHSLSQPPCRDNCLVCVSPLLRREADNAVVSAACERCAEASNDLAACPFFNAVILKGEQATAKRSRTLSDLPPIPPQGLDFATAAALDIPIKDLERQYTKVKNSDKYAAIVRGLDLAPLRKAVREAQDAEVTARSTNAKHEQRAATTAMRGRACKATEGAIAMLRELLIHLNVQFANAKAAESKEDDDASAARDAALQKRDAAAREVRQVSATLNQLLDTEYNQAKDVRDQAKDKMAFIETLRGDGDPPSHKQHRPNE